MTNFYEQYASIKPWLQKKTKVNTNYECENLQSYEDRSVRVHSVRLLLHLVPLLLVAPRQVLGSLHSPAGVPLDCGFP